MKKGFTLAEVLITLGIIGVVAALTMPSLIAKYQEKQTVTRMKKAYSVLSSAMQYAVMEYGEVPGWELKVSGDNSAEDIQSKNKVFAYLTKNIKGKKMCDYTDSACIDKYSFDRYTLDGTYYAKGFSSIYKLPDGTHLTGLWVVDPQCNKPDFIKNVCGQIFIDLNGSKAPNTQGKDVFMFWFTKNSIIPIGTESETRYSFDQTCNPDGPSDILNGYGCAAWVIFNENMDYLKCHDDLSWTGKKKCK